MLKMIITVIQDFTNHKILDSTKFKASADDKCRRNDDILDSMKHPVTDDNFKFDENVGKFSEKIENAGAKGGIARYEQFLLFHRVFKRLVMHTHKNKGLFGKGMIQIMVMHKEAKFETENYHY